MSTWIKSYLSCIVSSSPFENLGILLVIVMYYKRNCVLSWLLFVISKSEVESIKIIPLLLLLFYKCGKAKIIDYNKVACLIA